MRFHVLALDYDGTIAEEGHMDPDVRAAIDEARAHGLVVILVTGRILADLKEIAGDLRCFDAVVAENGADLYFPESGRSLLLGEGWPASLIEALRQHGINIGTGRCVVEAAASDASTVLSIIREQELPLSVVFNRGRLMVLPNGISKATGLQAALRTLRLSEHNTIAIGDAENDHPLLATAEIGVAVPWGSEPLQRRADLVLVGDGPRAVATFVRQMVSQPRLTNDLPARRQLLLGTVDSGQPFYLAVRGRNLLIAGDPRSGKSWITGLLSEQLVIHGYSLCVIDPEGDYAPLEALPGVVRLTAGALPPPLEEVISALRHPDISVVLDLSPLEQSEKRTYVARLLPGLATYRRQYGLPHRIVIDEAHYFLHDPGIEAIIDLELAGYTLVTYRLSQLHPRLLTACEAVIVTRLTDPHEIQAALMVGGQPPTVAEVELISTLGIGEAVVLPNAAEAGSRLCRFRVAARLTEHARHRQKYLEFPVPERDAFVFTRGGRPTGQWARSLTELARGIGMVGSEVLDGHLRRHDFSRWIIDIYGDYALAAQVKALENQHTQQLITSIANQLVSILPTNARTLQAPRQV